MTVKKGKVYLVGAGPGDPGLLTLRGAKILSEADVIVYDRLVNEALLEINATAKKIYAGKNIVNRNKLQKGQFGKEHIAQKKTNKFLVKYAKEGNKVVRLKGGDPMIFGRGGEELTYLKRNHIAYEVIPGVSAGFAVPSYAGIPVTDRRYASTVTFVTGHEDQNKKETSIRWEKISKINGTIISFMGVRTLPLVVKHLLKAGKPERTLVSVIEQGTTPRQKVVEGTLKTITGKVKRAGISSPALTVIGEVNQLRKTLAWYEKKPLYGKTVLLTRAKTQVSQLRSTLEEQGACVLEYPAIKILPTKNPKPFNKALSSIADFDWIVFTSVNGIEAFFDRFNKPGRDARDLAGIKFAVIGSATQEALLQKGIRADLQPKAFTSEALFKALSKQKLSGKKILLPRADIAPKTFARNLEKRGAQVSDIAAYQTAPSEENKKKLQEWIKSEKIDYVLFTSSSTVHNFFSSVTPKLKKQFKARYVSIGPVTSRTLRECGVKPYKQAKEHTVPGLVEVLIRG